MLVNSVIRRFPFCDSGSVADLLKPSQIPLGVEVAIMPAPQREREIRKVFEEYKVGKSSMRIEDIKAGLEVDSRS